jgi:thiamine-phosphate pyrophosphorylase
MIVISNPQFIPTEIAVINALFEAGLEVFHLRKPEANISEMKDFISQIDDQFHSRIMIHSHYELLDSFNLRGIHFTEKTKELQDSFAHATCIKSMAVHDLPELDNVKPFIDYVFLSPLFPSVSKEGYSKQWDFEELKSELAIKRNFRIIALGGITLGNVKTVNQLGFDDYALLGSIWEPVKSGCPISQIVSIFKSYNQQ